MLRTTRNVRNTPSIGMIESMSAHPKCLTRYTRRDRAVRRRYRKSTRNTGTIIRSTRTATCWMGALTGRRTISVFAIESSETSRTNSS